MLGSQPYKAFSELAITYLGLSQMKCHTIIPSEFFAKQLTAQTSQNALQLNSSPELQRPPLSWGSCYTPPCRVSHIYSEAARPCLATIPGKNRIGWWSIVTFDGKCVLGLSLQQPIYSEPPLQFSKDSTCWTLITKSLCLLYTWLLAFSGNNRFTAMSLLCVVLYAV